MCGRVSQKEAAEFYAALVGWKDVQEPGPGLRFNVPPQTRPMVLHQLGGTGIVERLYWGFKPSWSEWRKPPNGNANLSTVLRGSPMWSPLLSRRVVMPVDGWYEWTGPKNERQPWYISATDGRPLLLAGITAWTPGSVVDAAHGFAVVTDAAAGGLKDIHDRRPVCLTRDNALSWLDAATPVGEALELLSTSRPESVFKLWEVTKRMGSSRYQSEDASARIAATGA